MCFWLLAGEASNVFLNLKIMMAAAGYKGTWYLINGAVFTLVFGSVRVALYGYGLWHLWQTRCARSQRNYLAGRPPQAFHG